MQSTSHAGSSLGGVLFAEARQRVTVLGICFENSYLGTPFPSSYRGAGCIDGFTEGAYLAPLSTATKGFKVSSYQKQNAYGRLPSPPWRLPAPAAAGGEITEFPRVLDKLPGLGERHGLVFDEP